MEKIQFDNDDFILYAPDSLKYVTDNMIEYLQESFDLYKGLFEIECFRKIQINFFDDINKFREFIYDLRGENQTLPSYAKGTFDKGMINAFITTDMDVESYQYHKTLYMASHELFHIMYKELIWEKEGNKRIVWFDEGMAQFFSNENACNLNDENFERWLNTVVEKTKKIPNLNDLKHGENFETDDYSGYSLSLLSVKYLYDLLGFDEFKKLMHDNNKIMDYGNIVIEAAIEYYK